MGKELAGQFVIVSHSKKILGSPCRQFYFNSRSECWNDYIHLSRKQKTSFQNLSLLYSITNFKLRITNERFLQFV